MNRPQAYVEYLIEFHATRDFFECHELLEEYWKDNPTDGYSEQWLACIQIAVGQYHERRGNHRGAKLMYEGALHKINASDVSVLGLDQSQLIQLIAKHIEACEQRLPYIIMNLPITDDRLMKQCIERCQLRNIVWGNETVSDEVINRHLTRDRTEVVAARLAALKQKHNKSSDR